MYSICSILFIYNELRILFDEESEVLYSSLGKNAVRSGSVKYCFVKLVGLHYIY